MKIVPGLGNGGSWETWEELQQRASVEAKSQTSSWSNYHATKNLICLDIFLITGKKRQMFLKA